MPLPVHKPQPNIGDILVKAKVVTPDQLTEALAHAARERTRLEEAVIDMGLVQEAVLLKALSAHFQTQFLSTEKLAKAAVDKRTLAMIPREAAETLGLFPVAF